MEFIAQTETSSLNTANIAGLLNTSENKTAGKGDSAFAELFNAQIHENTSETTADAGSPFEHNSLDATQKQDVIIKDIKSVFSHDADDADQGTMNDGIRCASSVQVASSASLLKQAVDASTDQDAADIKKSAAAFFQGNAPDATRVNIKDETTGKSSNGLTTVADDVINAAVENSSLTNNDKIISIEDSSEQLQGILTSFINCVKSEATPSNAASESAQTDTTVADEDTAEASSRLIEQLQNIMAAIIEAIKSETAASNGSHNNSRNLMTASDDEAADLLTAVRQQTSTGGAGKTSTMDNKIDLLKTILAAFLHAVQSEAATTPTEAGNAESRTSAAGKETTAALTDLAQQAATNRNGQAAEDKIGLIKDILAAFLRAVQSEAAASNTEAQINANATTVSDDETASSTEISKQASISDDSITIPESKMDLLKDILAAFLQESGLQASAANRINGDMATVNRDDDAASAIANAGETSTGKNMEKKVENGRTAFINRIAELLNSKGNDGASITEMISRIQTLSGTAQRKSAIDAESTASALAASEKINKKTASMENEMEAFQSVVSNERETQATGKANFTQIASTQDGMTTTSARQEGPSTVQSVSKIKNHDPLDVPDQKTSTVNASSFSDILTGEAKTSPGIKMQALIDQIAQAKQQMGSDYGRVKITLNPPDLGAVDMEVIIRQNKVEVTLVADHASVQQMLQAHSEEVKSALQRQDMKIDAFQVLLQNNNNGSQQQSNPWASMQGQGRQESAYFTNQEESADQTLTGASHPAPSSQGLVSIFV